MIGFVLHQPEVCMNYYGFDPNGMASWKAINDSAERDGFRTVRLADYEWQFVLKQLALLNQQYKDEGDMESETGNFKAEQSAYANQDLIYHAGFSIATQLFTQHRDVPCNGCKTRDERNAKNQNSYATCVNHPLSATERAQSAGIHSD